MLPNQTHSPIGVHDALYELQNIAFSLYRPILMPTTNFFNDNSQHITWAKCQDNYVKLLVEDLLIVIHTQAQQCYYGVMTTEQFTRLQTSFLVLGPSLKLSCFQFDIQTRKQWYEDLYYYCSKLFAQRLTESTLYRVSTQLYRLLGVKSILVPAHSSSLPVQSTSQV